MNNNSEPNRDPLWEPFHDLDFSDAKPVADMPALARLKAERAYTVTVTLPVDSEVLERFKVCADRTGMAWEGLMAEALRQFAIGIYLNQLSAGG